MSLEGCGCLIGGKPELGAETISSPSSEEDLAAFI